VSRVGGHKAISLLSTVDFANVSAVISIKRFGGQGFPNIFSTGIDSVCLWVYRHLQPMSHVQHS